MQAAISEDHVLVQKWKSHFTSSDLFLCHVVVVVERVFKSQETPKYALHVVAYVPHVG